MFFLRCDLKNRCTLLAYCFAALSFALLPPFCLAAPIEPHSTHYSGAPNDEQVVNPIKAEAKDGARNQNWTLSPADLSLRRGMMSWVQSADWRLQWDASWDVAIVDNANFEGDFVDAIHSAVSTLAAAHLFALIDTKNRVVRITAIGPE